MINAKYGNKNNKKTVKLEISNVFLHFFNIHKLVKVPFPAYSNAMNPAWCVFWSAD